MLEESESGGRMRELEKQTDNLIEFAKEQCEIFPEDSAMGKYLRETLRMLQAEPCEDAVSRKELEKLKRWRLPYDTNTTIPKSDLFVKLADIRDLPSVTPTLKNIGAGFHSRQDNSQNTGFAWLFL